MHVFHLRHKPTETGPAPGNSWSNRWIPGSAGTHEAGQVRSRGTELPRASRPRVIRRDDAGLAPRRRAEGGQPGLRGGSCDSRAPDWGKTRTSTEPQGRAGCAAGTVGTSRSPMAFGDLLLWSSGACSFVVRGGHVDPWSQTHPISGGSADSARRTRRSATTSLCRAPLGRWAHMATEEGALSKCPGRWVLEKLAQGHLGSCSNGEESTAEAIWVAGGFLEAGS